MLRANSIPDYGRFRNNKQIPSPASYVNWIHNGGWLNICLGHRHVKHTMQKVNGCRRKPLGKTCVLKSNINIQ